MAGYVYTYADAAGVGRELLGGKGAGLAEMSALGIPVPAGFVVTTEACTAYMEAGGTLPAGLAEEIEAHVGILERATGKRFGDPANPLLVSVRSGAAVSMPGMMDTILNLGLNGTATEALGAATRNPRFAYDAYRRLIAMYGEVVLGIEADRFERELERLKSEREAGADLELDAADLRELARRFEAVFLEHAGEAFPADPHEQLRCAVAAVFDSWNTPRAQVYRRAHGIPESLGTAASVVQMVFGNKGDTSGTGVAFTRDPSTGEPGAYGEFLPDAQGEDVVAGTRTPYPLARMAELMPGAHAELLATLRRLEEHYREMQDIEFTVEEGKLYILQTRTGKRTATAAVRIAVDMEREGLLTQSEALTRIDPAQLDQLLHPMIDPEAEVVEIARGLNASPGAATGRIVFDADTAEDLGRAGEDVILVRWETTPDDIHGLIWARGVLTAHGGMTSHAAVVARGMGKPAVTGCTEVELEGERLSIAGHTFRKGDLLTIDGGRGSVIAGAVPLIPPRIDENFETVLAWADEARRLRVRANADTPEDAAKAREFGAEGIGLCRTEHMFMAESRLPLVRRMIMARSEEERRGALEPLLPMQQDDFEGILGAMAGLPVTIRLLDPPLHEFLPPVEEAESAEMAQRIRALREANPMLGTRGCRLGLLYPEIYEMQVRAIVRAALAVEERTGKTPSVEIMHPLVGFSEELRRLRELTVETAAAELEASGRELAFSVGTMIELPRACVRADEIAAGADFFSFGTNDLTQTTLGFSRDDAEGKFLSHYLDERILDANPFETLDRGGVGELMRIGVERARASKPGIKLGICGEHGGDPVSVAFCHDLGLDYVSCSPFRVPLARLAAAQAALAEVGIEAIQVGG